jgi:hypothetical protein
MLEALSKPLSLAVAGLSVIGFLVGLGASGVMVAFTVIGLLYLLVVPLGYLYASMGENKPASSKLRAYSLGAVGIALWVYIVVNALSQDLTSFGFYPLFGMVAALIAVGLLATAFVLGYRRGHQTCPECMNVVHAQARLCHFCGLRFQPPVPWPQPEK